MLVNYTERNLIEFQKSLIVSIVDFGEKNSLIALHRLVLTL